MKLHPLTEGDFFRILSEPEFGLIKLNIALLATEGVEIKWSDCGLKEVARMAAEMNKYTENIGARRLNTVLERITDDLSFNASNYSGKTVNIDKAFVVDKLKTIEINRTQKGLL
jgi:ATP-dependent HslUV protease ATP-binding subunit HslU